MTSLINLEGPSTSNKMSSAELQSLLEDIARKTDSPEVQLTLLQLISQADLTPQQIQETNAERYFRKLAMAPVKRYTQQTELVKLKAKALIKQWGVQRSQTEVSLDDLIQKAKLKPQQKHLPQILIASTGFRYRDNVRNQLVQLFRANCDDKKWAYEVATRLEDDLYRVYKQGKPYCDKCRSLIYNLSDPSNTKPLAMLINKQVTPEEFIKLDTFQLASEKMRMERDQIQMRGMWDKRTDWEHEEVKMQGDKFQGLFLCEECGSNKTGFIQVQIDRADEPMHCFIFCYDCKARFSKH